MAFTLFQTGKPFTEDEKYKLRAATVQDDMVQSIYLRFYQAMYDIYHNLDSEFDVRDYHKLATR